MYFLINNYLSMTKSICKTQHPTKPYQNQQSHQIKLSNSRTTKKVNTSNIKIIQHHRDKGNRQEYKVKSIVEKYEKLIKKNNKNTRKDKREKILNKEVKRKRGSKLHINNRINAQAIQSYKE